MIEQWVDIFGAFLLGLVTGGIIVGLCRHLPGGRERHEPSEFTAHWGRAGMKDDVVITNTPRAGEPPRGYRYVPRSGMVDGLERIKHDPVSAPSHYKSGNGIEVIDVVDGFDLNANMAKAVEYILRADRKGGPVEDLEKACAYIGREIAKRKHFAATGEKYLPLGRGFAR